MQINENDFLEKIIFLEKKLGQKVSYKIFEPENILDFNPNIIELQNEASQIANFIELKDITFIITCKNLGDNVGGDIELDRSNCAIINISPKIAKYNYSILATLSHEITHKYLEQNNIFFENMNENEIFTDIAAVFLGLGKLLLNGCHQYQIIKNGTIFLTEKKINEISVGYLTRDELMFVYLLICTMRKVDDKSISSNLNSDSIEIMKSCKKEYSGYFNSNYHNKIEQNKNIENLVSSSQFRNISLNNLILQCNNISKQLTDIMEHLSNENADIFTFDILNNEYDPCIKYLNCLKMKKFLNSNADKYRKFFETVKILEKQFDKIKDSIKIIATIK